ncbi:MAG TPA: nucleotide sugar dehydrogenase [Anaerolineales bacterium]|nr:nucleotide sugar dehydrogenase [Anaerolineales bacterium]
MLAELHNRITQKLSRLAVIGLGYVGLPVACEFARVGFNVLGVDIQENRIDRINAGMSPVDGMEPGLQELIEETVGAGVLRATTDYGEVGGCDVILICVETPVEQDNLPRYDALRSALVSCGEVLKRGSLIIIESTTAPGTMQSLVKPVLEQVSSLRVNEDFFLGNCPERVMPGKLLVNLRTIGRVVGGMTPETSEAMFALYRHIVDADLDAVDCVTAELVKTVENTYRDVQIAFANEIALICEQVGGDVWKVRQLVNKSPGRQMLYAGSGVGGHCIPKDPWLLVSSVRSSNIPIELIPAARSINNYMPIHMLDLIQAALAEFDRDITGSRILLMGFAYLEDTGDTRNSPSQVLASQLLDKRSNVIVHDPYVNAYQGPLLDMAQDCDAAVLMVKHNVYRSLDLNALRISLRTPILVDGRGFFGAEAAARAGLKYWALGVAKNQG